MRLRQSDVTWREIDGDLVILDLQSSTYFTANASASILMQQLAEGRTGAELKTSLINEYGITADQAEADVQAFVESLSHAGLLEEPATD
ncbi:MAG: PqqD family protein [Propionibacteriaceae bacterium]|nr:PqqD family protein [Propionibacteriaceae bacterium]